MAYFSHDEGARNDPKLVKVLMRLGQAGKGVYWDLVEMLYEQGGYLPLAEVESYAFALRTDPELVTKLLNDFGLFKQDAERFWSESVLDRMHLRTASSSRRAAAGSKGGKARAEREALAKAALEQSLSIPQALLENPEALLNDFQAIKGKEIKGKEIKEPLPSVEDAASAAAPAPVEVEEVKPLPESPATELRTPGGAADVGTSLTPERGGRWQYDPAEIAANLVLPFDTPEFRQGWAAYRAFREEDKQRRLTGGMQEQELLRKLSGLAGGSQQKALDIIAQTIAKGWKDLYKLDEQRAPTQQPGQSGGGQKPTLNAVAMAGSLASRRFNQPGGSAGDTGQTTGAYPGQGTGVAPGFGPN